MIFATDHAMLGVMALLAMPPPGFDELSIAEELDHVNILRDRVASDPDAVPVADWHRGLRVAPADQAAQP
ncbi:MAG: hypothetical protein ABJE95_02495 [Byssovorax sp.]